jgi:hypothetical protein
VLALRTVDGTPTGGRRFESLITLVDRQFAHARDTCHQQAAQGARFEISSGSQPSQLGRVLEHYAMIDDRGLVRFLFVLVVHIQLYSWTGGCVQQTVKSR